MTTNIAHNQQGLEKFITDSLSFVARKAVYMGELPSAAVGEMLKSLDNILPQATVKAFQEAMATEEKLMNAKGIDASEVVRQAEKLSNVTRDFSKDQIANNEVMKAINTTTQQQNSINKNYSQEAILEKFNVQNRENPVVSQTNGISMENKMNM